MLSVVQTKRNVPGRHNTVYKLSKMKKKQVVFLFFLAGNIIMCSVVRIQFNITTC